MFFRGRPKVRPNFMSANEILEITPRHREIIRLKALGHSNIEIAVLLGITSVTVGNVLRSQLGNQSMATLQERMDEKVLQPAERIRMLQGKAVDKLEEILNDEKAPRTEQRRAAENILDRGTLPRVHRQQHDIAMGLFEIDLEEIKKQVSSELAIEPIKYMET